MKLSELKTGETGRVIKVLGSGNFRKRIIEMGFVRGKNVKVLLNAPLKDPIKYQVMDYEVSLRRSEAALIEVLSRDEALTQRSEHTDLPGVVEDAEVLTHIAQEKGKTINVALIGNPNCGKTSLFNLASGAHEHVGNYSGITVDAKEGYFDINGYRIRMADLPGTYSLSTYSPEELRHIFEQKPDLILNIVAASNLERNLYLTTQLLDMDIPMVIALNMYDELEKNGDKFDYNALGGMIGVPIVPTVASEGFDGNSGLQELFDTVIRVYEGNEPSVRHVHINHGGDLQHAIDRLTRDIKAADNFESSVSARFFATKLMEKDRDAEDFVRKLSNAGEIFAYRDKWMPHIEKELGEDCESAVINAKYGFISGALTETLVPGGNDVFKMTRIIDRIITHKFWGYPIFLLFMWVMFACTFTLGAYPQEWIEKGVELTGEWLRGFMAEGWFSSLLIDGVFAGVGAVLAFLPNIIILFFFISLMEDSGYMAREAFIMDTIMHRVGLHGRSFIPMLMGFGCNVPAIMALTMLMVPFMSCSARLPVYMLFVDTFFERHKALVMISLYAIGISLSVLFAIIMKRTRWFRQDNDDTVNELPEFRIPKARNAAAHIWERVADYLQKICTVILWASIIIWALEYFPSQDLNDLEHSYLASIGQFVSPLMEPLGFDWKMSVCLLTGLPAKEAIVSTLAILYGGDITAAGFTPLTAFSFMLFVLLYFPCVATIATLHREAGKQWAWFTVFHSLILAWLISFLVYQVGLLFI